MPTLEIITIGTELLLGEITDTNSTYIARTLRDHGIDIYRISTIGDNPGRIAATIKEALNRADIIITTGGLGPTVDDPTRQAVADATDRDLVYEPHLWEEILQRFKAYGHKPTENNRRQAYIPQGAIPISNPVGTAPCYVVELGDACVISLPGVPSEMKFLLAHSIIPYLKKKFSLQSKIIKATVLHAVTMGESAIDEIIADLETLTNPTVGLLAHPGQVDIRVTAKASSEQEAHQLIQPIAEEIRSRLGMSIYGQDEETLEGRIGQLLDQLDLSLTVVDSGSHQVSSALSAYCQYDKIQTHSMDETPLDIDGFLEIIQTCQELDETDIGFGTALILDSQMSVFLVFNGPDFSDKHIRHYGSTRENAFKWAHQIGLDYLRQYLIKMLEKGDSWNKLT